MSEHTQSNTDETPGRATVEENGQATGNGDTLIPDDAPPTRHGQILPVLVPASNPYGRLFTGIAFKISEARQAYERRDGSKSRKVGTCAILLVGGAATVTGSINAILPKGARKVQIDVNTMANGQTFQNAINPVDAESAAQFKEWRAAASKVAADWLKAQGWGKPTAKAPETAAESEVGADYFN